MKKPGAIPHRLVILTELVKWAGTRAEFCRLTGVKQPNLSSYFSRTKKFTDKQLQRWAAKIFRNARTIEPLVLGHEFVGMNQLPDSLSGETGVYVFYDSSYRVIYVGQSTNLLTEMKQQLKKTATKFRLLGKKIATPARKDIVKYISAFKLPSDDQDFLYDVEALMHRLVLNVSSNRNVSKFRK